VLACLVLAAIDPGALTPTTGAVVNSRDARTSPNVVLFLTDDQRSDTLGAMPAVQTLLVRKGTTFTNAMVPTPLCCPSRATILTGLYAHHTRVFGNGDIGGNRFGGWPQFRRRGMEYRTIATALQRSGYRTGLFGKYLNNFANQTHAGYKPPGWDTFTAFRYIRGAYFDYRLSDGSWHGHKPRDYSTDVLARRADRFIRSTPRDQPLFMYFAPFGPHKPYTPAPRHRGAAAGLPSVGAIDLLGGTTPAWKRGKKPAAIDEVDRVHKAQVETLLSVDDAVRKLMTALKSTGRARDTLFIFLSDNGYFWGEHGLLGKDSPYDAGLRIPMVVRWDGQVPAGVTDHRLALNVDLAGTISRVASAGMTTDGLDLLGSRRRTGFVVEAMDGYGGRPAYCGWRTKKHLYVRWATGRTELYNYRTDPREEHNLAGDLRRAGLKKRMQAHAMKVCSPEPPGFDW